MDDDDFATLVTALRTPSFAGCTQGNENYLWEETAAMKKTTANKVEQPKPFTPGVTKAMVREHAYRMFRDKLPDHPLTLADWVLAEKDLVNSMEAEEEA